MQGLTEAQVTGFAPLWSTPVVRHRIAVYRRRVPTTDREAIGGDLPHVTRAALKPGDPGFEGVDVVRVDRLSSRRHFARLDRPHDGTPVGIAGQHLAAPEDLIGVEPDPAE